MVEECFLCQEAVLLVHTSEMEEDSVHWWMDHDEGDGVGKLPVLRARAPDLAIPRNPAFSEAWELRKEGREGMKKTGCLLLVACESAAVRSYFWVREQAESPEAQEAEHQHTPYHIITASDFITLDVEKNTTTECLTGVKDISW